MASTTLRVLQTTVAKQSTAAAKTLPKVAIATLQVGNYEILGYKSKGGNYWDVTFAKPFKSADGTKTFQSWIIWGDDIEFADSSGKAVKVESSKILGYVSQPDGSTCQSAAICRVLGNSDVMGVRRSLVSQGVAGDPAVMGSYLASRVKEYRYTDKASLNDAIDALYQGFQLIIHTYLTEAGHVIGLSARDGKAKIFNAEDPWAEFDAGTWKYLNKSGDDAQYSDLLIYSACVAGQSNWDAREIYRSGQVSYLAPGMWMHSIKN
jgi:hypothetical protein